MTDRINFKLAFNGEENRYVLIDFRLQSMFIFLSISVDSVVTLDPTKSSSSFCSLLSGDELFSAVQAKVTSIVKADVFDLYWNGELSD